MKEPYPHERRVQRYAYMVLAAATGLALALALRGDGRLFGLELPLLVPLVLALLGAIVGAVATHRRSTPWAMGAGALLVLAILPGGRFEADLLGYVLGFTFGALLLAFGELVHMTVRYERAHRAVEEDNVPEEHINRVTDEALKTLASRASLALGGAGLAVLLAYLLTLIGPRQWREALETASPLGVAVTGFLLLGAGSLYVLLRGSRIRRGDESTSKESASDVAE